MRITIDTTEDSKEEIKKVIQLLSALVPKEKIRINRVSLAENTDLVNSQNEVKKEAENTPINFSSFINLIESSNPNPPKETKKKAENTFSVVPY